MTDRVDELAADVAAFAQALDELKKGFVQADFLHFDPESHAGISGLLERERDRDLANTSSVSIGDLVAKTFGSLWWELRHSRSQTTETQQAFEEKYEQIATLERDLKSLREDVAALDRKITEVRVRRNIRRVVAVAVPVIILLGVIGYVAFLVETNWAQKAHVAIDFNVGEIVGGTLGGLGALIAGLAYARSRPAADAEPRG